MCSGCCGTCKQNAARVPAQQGWHSAEPSAVDVTLMLGANVNVKVVSEMPRHSQAAFTMDRYQHVSLARQREAASAVAAMLA